MNTKTINNSSQSPPAAANAAPALQPVAWIGLDWGHHSHAFALQERGGSPEEGTLEHSAESLHGWLRALEKRFGGRPVALGIETSRGAVIPALLQYAWLTLYPINPVPARAIAAPSPLRGPAMICPTHACSWNWCAIMPPSCARSNRKTSRP